MIANLTTVLHIAFVKLETKMDNALEKLSTKTVEVQEAVSEMERWITTAKAEST